MPALRRMAATSAPFVRECSHSEADLPPLSRRRRRDGMTCRKSNARAMNDRRGYEGRRTRWASTRRSRCTAFPRENALSSTLLRTPGARPDAWLGTVSHGTAHPGDESPERRPARNCMPTRWLLPMRSESPRTNTPLPFAHGRPWITSTPSRPRGPRSPSVRGTSWPSSEDVGFRGPPRRGVSGPKSSTATEEGHPGCCAGVATDVAGPLLGAADVTSRHRPARLPKQAPP